MENAVNRLERSTREQDIALARKGDDRAFSRLIEEELLYMYRISKSILQHEADVEDAVQEAVIKAWTQLRSLKDNRYFKTWLIRILINQCNEILRKQKRIVLTNDNINFTEDYEDSSERMALKDAINRLDGEQRTVIILFYFEDLSYSEISYALGIPEGTVKSRLSRAKNKLNNLLSDRIGG